MQSGQAVLNLSFLYKSFLPNTITFRLQPSHFTTATAKEDINLIMLHHEISHPPQCIQCVLNVQFYRKKMQSYRNTNQQLPFLIEWKEDINHMFKIGSMLMCNTAATTTLLLLFYSTFPVGCHVLYFQRKIVGAVCIIVPLQVELFG